MFNYISFCDLFRSQNPVGMHTFSICTLSTLQNITKREGQTGVKQYALIQGYTLTVVFHSYMYVKHIIMVWFLFMGHSILSCLCQCQETNNNIRISMEKVLYSGTNQSFLGKICTCTCTL